MLSRADVEIPFIFGRTFCSLELGQSLSRLSFRRPFSPSSRRLPVLEMAWHGVHRSRRSFRKSYYILLVVALFLWSTGRFRSSDDGDRAPPELRTRNHHDLPENQQPLPPSSHPLVGKPQLDADYSGSHLEARPNELIRNKGSVQGAGLGTPDEDDSDSNHGDIVEKLDHELDEGDDIASKLRQVDDGDTSSSDAENVLLDGEQQLSLPGEGRRKQTSGRLSEERLGEPTGGTELTQTRSRDGYTFPDPAECESLKDKADSLPNMIYLPFEDVLANMTLEGWEDEWVANARFKGPRLSEPKIDFVYNCKWYDFSRVGSFC
jgi:hypothetical protein